MSEQPRYRVIPDLNEQEYNQQRNLASLDSGRRPPELEIFSRFNGLRFDEGHISRIGADAYFFTTGDEPTTEAQHELEEAAGLWTFEKKTAFMTDAALHWLPPAGEETSHWHTTVEYAEVFLWQHPEVYQHLGKPSEDEHPRACAHSPSSDP